MASSIPWLVQVGPAMPLRWQILWTNAPGAPLHKADGFAIETQNLRKVYGKKVAVRNLSLSVRCGEIFGFLGPQGAGKSNSKIMLLGLTPHREKRLREFSKGMLQRIGLAQALIHEPELIFLDEPTSGLDPMGRRLVRDVIRAQRERGATVFLNSHLLSEVEITCDQV